jgi:YHS domain-containing protein
MRKINGALIALIVVFTSFAAFAGDMPTGPVTKVDPKTVCMVNEMAMGKEQIAVEVDGKTYYGCCEMCKNRLATDDSKRVAIDPISGKEVDKAEAVIGAQEDGRVFYFENEENLKKVNALYAKK